MALTEITSKSVKDGEIVNADINASAAIAKSKLAALNIAAGDIADEAVTLAKLEHGDGSSNGKFLRSNNGADPSWETVTSSDTTYSISCVDGDNGDEEKIRLTAGGSGSGTDDVVLEAGTGLSIARSSDKITFTNTVTGGTFSIDGDNNIYGGTNAGNTGTWSGATHNFCAGYDAGTDLTSGDNNVFIGRNAGMNATDAEENIVIGDGAWENGTSNHRNVIIGHNACQDFEAGWGNENVYIGSDAGKEHTRGNGWVVIGGYAADLGVGTGTGGESNNTIIGYVAGRDITSGRDNTLIGKQADDEITTGNYNTVLGSMALNKNETGDSNVAIGYNSMGETGADADKNTCVGMNSGTSITSGGNNTFLGYRAGTAQSPGGGSNTSDTIILGDNDVTALYCADTSISSSDQRDKTDITNFTPGLSFVKDLRPVTYRWDKRSWYNEYNASDQLVKENTPDGSKKKTKQHIGFLAQEVLKVEQDHGFADSKDNMLTVNLQADDYAYGIKYERLIPVLVNAIKELEAKVAALEAK